MVKFIRNKLVSVYREDDDTLIAHGLLEDDIYGLEIDVTLSLSDLEIKGIRAQWKRAENSECSRGLPFLQEAIGLRLGEGFNQRVQKLVGRKVCRHFADILLESCYAARDAAQLIRGEIEKVDKPAKDLDSVHPENREEPPPSFDKPRLETENRSQSPNKPMPLFEKETKEMVIDLHVHTFPASPCSSVTVEALIEEAKKIGLDGFCLTDHNHVWDQAVVDDLRRKSNFLILRGNEITTDQGDMVVFGLDKEIQGIIKLEALREEVSMAGGFIIVAHPFRGFLTFGIGKLGLTPEQAMERPLFRRVDAVEVMNSKVTEKENAFAAQVAARVNRPATGGSDAHTASALGTYATRFYQVIDDEKGLIEALKKGNYAPVAFRRERRERGAAHGKSH